MQVHSQASAAHAGRPTPDQHRAVGDVTLSQAGRLLSGLNGSTTLHPAVYALAWRLLERPKWFVDPSALIEALYEDPDREPEHAHAILRIRVMELRRALKAVTAGEVHIRTERNVGYIMEERRW